MDSTTGERVPLIFFCECSHPEKPYHLMPRLDGDEYGFKETWPCTACPCKDFREEECDAVYEECKEAY